MGLEDKNFPNGMKVLVVDDNLSYLEVMESHLKKCQYHVTTTNKIRKALKLLHQRKKYFDIMITNADMPEVDGIKLLQLVDLEFNVPVITCNDTKYVQHWINIGARDCLVKPMMMHELKHIWKHVVRRNNCIHPRSVDHLAYGNTPCGALTSIASDHVILKGKDIENSSGVGCNDNDELEKGNCENNVGSTNHKKPRFLWSSELHEKFVDIVNQLGHKAFPKKITELLNAKGLTRQIVASHLQKYRLYIRRSNKQGSTFDAFRPKDVRIGSVGGDYEVSRSLPQKRMFGLLNTNSMLSLRDLTNLMLQKSQLPNSFNHLGSFNSPNVISNQNSNLFTDLPSTSLFSPVTTSAMLNRNPHLTATNFENHSNSMFRPSSDIVSSGLSDNSDLLNWGTPQSYSLLQNALPASASPNVVTHEVSGIQTNPLDTSYEISSLNGKVQSLDYLSGPNNKYNFIGQQHNCLNQSPNFAINSSTITNPIITTIPPIVAGNIEHQNNLIDASSFTNLGGVPSNIDIQNPNNGVNLKFDGLNSSPADQSSSGYLEDIVARFLK